MLQYCFHFERLPVHRFCSNTERCNAVTLRLQQFQPGLVGGQQRKGDCEYARLPRRSFRSLDDYYPSHFFTWKFMNILDHFGRVSFYIDLYWIYWVGSPSFSNKFTEERLEDLRCRHGMQVVRYKIIWFWAKDRHGYGIAVKLYTVRCEWIRFFIYCNNFDFFRSLKLMDAVLFLPTCVFSAGHLPEDGKGPARPARRNACGMWKPPRRNWRRRRCGLP